jgi:3-methyladenine DNA glycosylase AlkD
MGQIHTITVEGLRTRLRELGDRQKAQFLQGFFKTGPGGYGEGDVFLGIRVPALRKLANQYKTLAPSELLPLLQSPVHEERLLALLVWVGAFSKGDGSAREAIYGMYLENTRYVNNWDLVDLSAPHIVGAFLMDRSREPLYRLAQSPTLWERRIAVMATFHFIRHNQFSDTLKISRLLLSDKEDLIHKAAGWMLREVGKRNPASEEAFLNEHCRQMPRTMLRYAIERFPEARRRRYLEGTI